MATAKGARQAFVQGEKFLNDNERRVFGFLDDGLGKANNAFQAGLGYYEPLADRYNAGSSLYADAIGLGGAAGTQRAQDAFSAGPGYQFSFDQGLQALNRRRAAGGMLNSGNADTDAINYGSGVANQAYDSWLGRLQNYDALGLATAGARTGIQNNIAQTALNDAQTRGQLATDNTSAKIGLFSNAMAAGDAVKNQLTANRLGAVSGGLNFLGGIAGLGVPGGGTLGGSAFTKLFG